MYNITYEKPPIIYLKLCKEKWENIYRDESIKLNKNGRYEVFYFESFHEGQKDFSSFENIEAFTKYYPIFKGLESCKNLCLLSLNANTSILQFLSKEVVYNDNIIRIEEE